VRFLRAREGRRRGLGFDFSVRGADGDSSIKAMLLMRSLPFCGVLSTPYWTVWLSWWAVPTLTGSLEDATLGEGGCSHENLKYIRVVGHAQEYVGVAPGKSEGGG